MKSELLSRSYGAGSKTASLVTKPSLAQDPLFGNKNVAKRLSPAKKEKITQSFRPFNEHMTESNK